MASKFKIGDKVVVDRHKGKIVNFKAYCLKYTVKFDDPNLIPPEMDYDEMHISMDQEDSVCPICKTKWKVLKFNMKTWKDCVKCNKTSEAIMEEIENKKNLPPPLPGSSRNKDRLLEEFELMLDGLDDLSLDDSDIQDWLGVYDHDDDDTF
jgi:hypothetical protein